MCIIIRAQYTCVVRTCIMQTCTIAIASSLPSNYIIHTYIYIHRSDQEELEKDGDDDGESEELIDASSEEEDDDHHCLLPLSDYEIARDERVRANKRKFNEIFNIDDGKKKAKKVLNFLAICKIHTQYKFTLVHAQNMYSITYHFLIFFDFSFQQSRINTSLQYVHSINVHFSFMQNDHGITSTTNPVAVGEMIAVRSNKYRERPLLGRITTVKQDTVVFDWLVGSYSGTWKDWRGRENGKSVIYSDELPTSDILMTSITLTKAKKLQPQTVATLKELY